MNESGCEVNREYCLFIFKWYIIGCLDIDIIVKRDYIKREKEIEKEREKEKSKRGRVYVIVEMMFCIFGW